MQAACEFIETFSFSKCWWNLQCVLQDWSCLQNESVENGL